MTTPIFSRQGLVDVTYRDDLGAVYLNWHSEFDETGAVREAVLKGLDFAKAHGVKHWLADVSASREPLSAADQAWVSGDEFREAVKAATLTRFVLVPPLPETGQDTAWLADWEANTLAAFGEGTQAKIMEDWHEIRALFGASERETQE